jgi:hypothetical protein
MNRGGHPVNMSYPDYRDYRDRTDVFEGVAALSSTQLSLSINGNPQRVAHRAARVDPMQALRSE